MRVLMVEGVPEEGNIGKGRREGEREGERGC